ncbi:SDR family NAD(P)-dependent oxidoreductase, partial [Klebsiella pneumoniae]
LPWMLKQGKGSIVNISSVATAGVNRVPYSAAKGGVNALTRSLALEYSANGIRINAVAPGGTEAPARRTPRNEELPSAQEQTWYQQVVDQT